MNAAEASPRRWLLMAGLERAGQPDPGLIAKARRGDPSALDEVVRRHQTRIYNFAYRMLRRREEAEDVTQEAFLKAFEALPRLRDDASFGAWVCRIAANLCLARLRSGALRFEVPTDPSILPEPGGARDDSLSLEVIGDVLGAIALLPPKYRLAVVAFYLEGRSYQEAARSAGVPLRTFKTRLYRARNILRAQLREEAARS